MNEEKPKGSRIKLSLNISQKKKVLDYAAKNMSLHQISRVTGVPRSTIKSIVSKRDVIVDQFRRGNKLKKRIRLVVHPEVERALYFWFTQQKVLRIPMTLKNLQEKARFFHEKLCTTPGCRFQASSGWAGKFKSRNSIKTAEASASVREAETEAFREVLMKKIEDMELTLEQVYNAEDLILYWKKLPLDTLLGLEENFSKEKVSFIACSNVTGSNRIPIQVISRQDKPLTFPTPWSKADSIFCTKSRNTWTTESLLKDWFSTIFTPCVQKFSTERNIAPKALLLINESAFIVEKLNSKNIEVLFMPSTMVQISQPMIQPFLTRSLRTQYRSRLLERIITKTRDWLETHTSTNLADSMECLSQSWTNLESSLIFEAWETIMTGFEAFELNFPEVPKKDHVIAVEANKLLQLLGHVHGNLSFDQLRDWIETADGPANDCLTDEQIVEILLNEEPEPEPKPVVEKKYTRASKVEEVDADGESSMNGFATDFVQVKVESHVEEEDDTSEEEEPEKISTAEHRILKAFNTLIAHYTEIKDQEKLTMLKKMKNEYLNQIKCKI